MEWNELSGNGPDQVRARVEAMRSVMESPHFILFHVNRKGTVTMHSIIEKDDPEKTQVLLEKLACCIVEAATHMITEAPAKLHEQDVASMDPEKLATSLLNKMKESFSQNDMDPEGPEDPEQAS